MQKVRIHIANEVEYIDSQVYVDVNLPIVPRVGELIYITQQQKEQLEEKAKASLKIARTYAPKWFFGASYNCEIPQKENLKDLDFDDARIVKSIAYFSDSEIIHVEIDQ